MASKYASAVLLFSEQDKARLRALAKLRETGFSTFIKDTLYEEVLTTHFQNEWNKCYKRYLQDQKEYKFDSELENVVMTRIARKSFERLELPDQLLLRGWLRQQLTKSETYFIEGYRISDNSSEWIYKFGTARILAFVVDSKVVILNFLCKPITEMLMDFVEASQCEGWDRAEFEREFMQNNEENEG